MKLQKVNKGLFFLNTLRTKDRIYTGLKHGVADFELEVFCAENERPDLYGIETYTEPGIRNNLKPLRTKDRIYTGLKLLVALGSPYFIWF